MTVAFSMNERLQHNSLIKSLLHHAQTNPTHDAIVTPNITLSYALLAKLVRAQATEFSDMGISGRSVIGIKCADDIQHLVSCLAAIYMGATSCTISTHETNLAQQTQSNRCGVTHVIDEDIALDPIALDINTESSSIQTPANGARLLFSTSGTTGEPKLVVHHDCDILMQAHRHISSIQERFTCLASMEHNFAKRHRLYCVATGATNIFLDDQQQTLVTQCQALNVNVMHVSAYQAQELLVAPEIDKLSNIRLKLGGSHVPLPLRQQLRDNITQHLQAGYGTTETGAIAFTSPHDSDSGESVGQPLPGIEIRTVTPERKTLDMGERGELAIRCDGMFREYLGKSKLTNARLEDGWFYTGDIGYLDKQQRIHLCGRTDDMFVFNSLNIYPQDIESLICQHPDVTDAVVLPKVSSIHGNIPVALIVFSKSINPDLASLKKFVQEHIGIRSPRQYTIVKKIPRNSSGKILRNDAIILSGTNEKIRSSIIRALSDANATDNITPSMLSAFEKNEKNITLREIDMDSLARMELLVTLETEYDTVIMPDEFAQFRSLNDIITRVLSPPSNKKSEKDLPPSANDININSTPNNTQHYIVRFFQRTFTYCHTVAHLNKALQTLENRLTPMEVKYLDDYHINGQLIPLNADKKFHTSLSHWLHDMKRMMQSSKKLQAEPFVSCRIAPTVRHFIGLGAPADKTLLICFSAKGSGNLMMPNAVLLQHSDSAQYDLMIISEPLRASYRLGVPSLGKNVTETIEWIANLNLINHYKHIRTLGSSAGAYPAVISAYRLGAEIAVSVGGRFPAERHIIRIINRIFTIWRASHKGHEARVLMSYCADGTRDRNYAKLISKICACSLVAVEFTNEKLGHRILERLVERNELALYLARTIFAKMDDELITTERANVVMSFPDNKIRAHDSLT